MTNYTPAIKRDKTNGDGQPSLRPLSELACIIEQNWTTPAPFAVSHIEALGAMTSTRSVLWGVTGLDAARSFLLTSRKWHGDTAREIKAELRAHIANHKEMQD